MAQVLQMALAEQTEQEGSQKKQEEPALVKVVTLLQTAQTPVEEQLWQLVMPQ